MTNFDHTVDPEPLADAQLLYESPRFRMAVERYRTVDGEVARPVIHHPGGVAIFAMPDPEHVLMVRQYRYPLRMWTYEIPAGTRDPGEAALATAQRELQEEAGYTATHWREWFSFYPSMGLSDELLTVYYAEGLSQVPTGRDRGELVGPVICSLDELRGRISDGSARDAKTLMALARLPGMAACYAETPTCSR